MTTIQRAKKLVDMYFVEKKSFFNLRKDDNSEQNNSASTLGIDIENFELIKLEKNSFKTEPEPIKIQIEVDINIAQKYIDTVALENLLKSVNDFMEANGFEYEAEKEPIYGSFFQKLFFKAKSIFAWTQPDTNLEEGGKILHEHRFDTSVTESSVQLATAASALIVACAPFDEIVIRTGVLILVKTKVDGVQRIMVENISPLLMKFLDDNPGTLREPNLVYHFLTELVERFNRMQNAEKINASLSLLSLDKDLPIVGFSPS